MRLPNRTKFLMVGGVVLLVVAGGLCLYKQNDELTKLAQTKKSSQDNPPDTFGGDISETKKDSNELDKTSQEDKAINNFKTSKPNNDVVDNDKSESTNNVANNQNSSKTTTNIKSTSPMQSTPYDTSKVKDKKQHKTVSHNTTTPKHETNSTPNKKVEKETEKKHDSVRTIDYDADLTQNTWNAWNNFRESNGVERLKYSSVEAQRSYTTAKSCAKNQTASHGYSQCAMYAPTMSGSDIIQTFACSDGHKRNMLDTHSVAGGVAVFKSSDGMIYCVLSFNDGW